MTITISPRAEAKLCDLARQEGMDPAALVEQMVEAYLPASPVGETVYTAENDPLMAHLEARIAAAPTDPAAIRDAESDLTEFMHNMNAARREIGARVPYPEIE